MELLCVVKFRATLIIRSLFNEKNWSSYVRVDKHIEDHLHPSTRCIFCTHKAMQQGFIGMSSKRHGYSGGHFHPLLEASLWVHDVSTAAWHQWRQHLRNREN